MKYYTLLLIMLFFAISAGCAEQPSVAGGIAEISLSEKGALVVKNSKEYENVEATMTTPDGRTYSYKATGAKAFEGQAIYAQMQAMIVNQQAQLFQMLPGVLAGAFGEALKAYTGGITPPVVVPAPTP